MRDAMLVVHFIGLAMGLGTSFAFMFLGMISAKMEEGEAKKFRMNTFGLSRMGHIGLALLIISGGYLMTPYWSTLTDSPILMAKLALVVVLGAVIGIMGSTVKKVKNGGDPSLMAKMRPLGMLGLLTAITIVVLAVLRFH